MSVLQMFFSPRDELKIGARRPGREGSGMSTLHRPAPMVGLAEWVTNLPFSPYVLCRKADKSLGHCRIEDASTKCDERLQTNYKSVYGAAFGRALR